MALFLCLLRHARFYGGRAGQPSGWPAALVAGSPTLHVRHLAAMVRWFSQQQVQRWSMTMKPSKVSVEVETTFAGAGCRINDHGSLDNRMSSVLADAMELPEMERKELAQMLSCFVNCGLWLDPESVRADNDERLRTLFKRSA